MGKYLIIIQFIFFSSCVPVDLDLTDTKNKKKINVTQNTEENPSTGINNDLKDDNIDDFTNEEDNANADSDLSIKAGNDIAIKMPNQVAFLKAEITGGNENALITWTKLSGPGNVDFSFPNKAETTAKIEKDGAYEIQVSISYGSLVASDSLNVYLSKEVLGETYSLPTDNQGKWQPGIDVGVEGGIFPYLAGGEKDSAALGNVINMVTDFGVDNTGSISVKDATVAALASASAGDVIYFPQGTYLFDQGFIYSLYKNDITIRGAGPELTKFRLSTSQPIFVFSNPGWSSKYFVQEVTGNKTKGTSVLQVGDTTGYTVGRRAQVLYENEVDKTRIVSGANPVWNSAGAAFARKTTVVIKEMTSNSLTVAPSLVADGSNLKVLIGTHPNATVGTDGWGFEDFSVDFDVNNHPTQFATIDSSTGSWFYNVHFLNFSKNTASGSCIKISTCHRCEVRKSVFRALPGSSSDGAIETSHNSNTLFIDNIVDGPFGVAFYDSGNSSQGLIAYNYVKGGAVSLFHNAHPSLNLIEGNIGYGHHSDGYHGSSSNNNIYRNWFYGPFGAILNRFKRDYVIVGNVFAEDMLTDHVGLSWGNPNMGNGAANGFAGPAGNSNQIGKPDYLQPGYGENLYIINQSDVFVGDFWNDWEITGNLKTRINDKEGVFTMSGGDWFVGGVATAGSSLLPTIHWDNDNEHMYAGVVKAVNGLDITIAWSSGILPNQGVQVKVFFGAAGWQERDLGVKASSSVYHNYSGKILGGNVEDSFDSVLPSSMAYKQKPSWWNEDGFTGVWPPVNPDLPVFNPEILPAGARFLNLP